MEEHDYHTFSITATPLKKPRSPLESPSPATATQIPWTAARCQRLLRPLSSKISHLKRLNSERLHRLDAAGQKSSGVGGPGPANKPLNEKAAIIKLCRQSSKQEDPDWDCDARPRKKIKRTYSGKASSLKLEPELQSKFSGGRPSKNGPMNILPQMLSQEPGSPSNLQASYPQIESSKKDSEASRKLAQLPRYSSCEAKGSSMFHEEFATPGGCRDRLRLFKGISDSLNTVLLATQTLKKNKTSNLGSRSLFATCLKQVPKYITLEERWALKENPDHDRNVSSEMYCELESTAVADGWQPLRVIVRAHSIFLIRAAFEDGTLGVKSMLEIADLCSRNDALDEAQSILDTLVVSTTGRTLPGSGTSLQHHEVLILSALRNFAESTRRYGFFYQQLSTFIASSVGSRSCCDAIVSDYLNVAIQHTAAGGHYAIDAGRFIQAIIRRGMMGSTECRRVDQLRQTNLDHPSPPSKKLSKRQQAQIEGERAGSGPTKGKQQAMAETLSVDFAGLVAVIYTICYGRLTASLVKARGHLPDTLEQMIFEAYRHSEVLKTSKQGKHPTKAETQNLATILLADIISSSTKNAPRLDEAVAVSGASEPFCGLVISEDIVDQLGSFVCKIAQCQRQVAKGIAFDSLKETVGLLAGVTESAASDNLTCSITGRVAVRAAFTFVEDYNLPAHLDWALKIEQAVKSKVETTSGRSFMRTPAKRLAQSRSGFRWEDGICEWIEKTPAMQAERPRSASRALVENDDSGDDLAPDTPLASQEGATSSMIRVSSKQAQTDVSSATSVQKSKLMLATCVKITTSRKEPVPIPTRQKAAPPEKILTREASDSRVFRKGMVSVTYDDIDELAGVPHAFRGVCNSSIPDMRERPLTLSNVSRLNRPTKRMIKKGLGANPGVSKVVGGAKTQPNLAALLDRENLDSDTEDELSFS